MSWEYSDYILKSGKDKVERLKFHILEVSNQIGNKYMSDGTLVDSDTLQDYIRDLNKELKKINRGGIFSEGMVITT